MTESAVKPTIQAYLDILNHKILPKLLAEGFKTNIINAREALANVTKTLMTKPVDCAKVWDDTLDTQPYAVPVRIFHPQPEQALPVLIYFHGGGGSVGSVTVYDPILRRLAQATSHIVIAAEYRLAPENPYPAGQTDALNCVMHFKQALEARGIAYQNRISIGGDSAGGAICSNLVRQLDLQQYPLAAQVLIYPSVDFCMGSASVQQFATGYFLTAERMRWYFEHYFQNGEDYCQMSAVHAEINPLTPPTLVFTAGFDPLRDEGIAYAQKLQAASIHVEHKQFDDLIHAYLNLEDLCAEECAATYAHIGAFLNQQTA